MNQSIEELQKEIREKQQKLVELRMKQPLKEIKNYTFKDKNGKSVDLNSLFKNKNELLVIHNMGKSCTYCTMWADGFRGYNDMLSDRMPWVLTSPDPYDVMHNFAKNRDWNFNYLSFENTSFASDLGFQLEKNDRTMYSPGVSALIKKKWENLSFC